MVIEYFKGPSGFWFVRLIARNGETMMISEAYANKSNAVRAARALSTRLNSNKGGYVHRQAKSE
jgi:uncharacterized protein YegP (UPF0339 family)